MCGIVGYIGSQNATPIILDGLKRLEYRGYDSAGIAVIQNNRIEIRREVGKLEKLANLLTKEPIKGNIGIGHTRWATHGIPSQKNAHPHLGSTGEVVVVHNGIVENFLELREELLHDGVTFHSDTDTEIIVHLIERYLKAGNSIFQATQKALSCLRGAHGIVVLSSKEPDKIIAARIGNAGGIVIGIGENEHFIASDLPAILKHTQKVVFLDPQQIAIVTAGKFQITDFNRKNISPQIQIIPWDPISAEKGSYRHFMEKEIHEQVRALTDTIAGRVDVNNGQSIRLPELNITPSFARKIQKIFITACGTAAHAGMVGKMLIERIAKIPVENEIASEFRYRDPIITENNVVLAISQSGETADTLAAMEEARKKSATIWSIVNTIGSQVMRLSDGYISMQCGPEISVASTKAYTAPLVDLYMLATLLGDFRGTFDKTTHQQLVNDLRTIPELVGQTLDQDEKIQEIAYHFKDIKNCLYLGRGINMPTAYEGALKLKEISYIHAEGYPAGEMKHGPIALIDKNMPIIVLALQDPWYKKMLNQIKQAKARGGSIIAIATAGDELISKEADYVIHIPKTPWMLSPVTSIVPLQLFAYHIATFKGLDVDQPRNLAKSVTVE